MYPSPGPDHLLLSLWSVITGRQHVWHRERWGQHVARATTATSRPGDHVCSWGQLWEETLRAPAWHSRNLPMGQEKGRKLSLLLTTKLESMTKTSFREKSSWRRSSGQYTYCFCSPFCMKYDVLISQNKKNLKRHQSIAHVSLGTGVFFFQTPCWCVHLAVHYSWDTETDR